MKTVINSISFLLISATCILSQPRIMVEPLELDPSPCLDEIEEMVINIQNIGDELLIILVNIAYLGDNRNDYLSIEPQRCNIEPGNGIDLRVFCRPWLYQFGHNSAEIHILSNDPHQGDVMVSFHAYLYWPPFIIHFNADWNLVSSPYELDHYDNHNQMPYIFYELWRPWNRSLIMVKDGQGRFYIPAHNFNNIPCWNFREGYQVKMARADELILSGFSIPIDTPLPLHQGWNLIAYFPAVELAAPEAFRNIREVLLLAKDGAGNFYNPERDFNNMPPLRRGQGYQVKVSQDIDLIWFVP